MGLNGLALCFATEATKKIWGFPVCDAAAAFTLSFHGAGLVTSGIVIWALNSGMDPSGRLESLAYRLLWH